MFKKSLIISLFILFIMYYSNNVNASDISISLKPLLLSGSATFLSFDDLVVDGFVLIESNVDYSKCGKYYAKYKSNNDNDETIYNRDVVILQDNYFDNNIYIDKIDKYNSTNVDSMDIHVVYENGFIGCTNIYGYGEIIVKYSSVNLRFKTLSVDRVVSLKVYNEYIYVVGQVSGGLNYFNTVFVVYDLYGNELTKRVFDGSSYDYVIGLDIIDDIIYIYGYSTSNDDIFTHYKANSKQLDSYILVSSVYDIDFTYFDISSNKDDELLDYSFNDNRVALLKMIINKNSDNDYVLSFYDFCDYFEYDLEDIIEEYKITSFVDIHYVNDKTYLVCNQEQNGLLLECTLTEGVLKTCVVDVFDYIVEKAYLLENTIQDETMIILSSFSRYNGASRIFVNCYFNNIKESVNYITRPYLNDILVTSNKNSFLISAVYDSSYYSVYEVGFVFKYGKHYDNLYEMEKNNSFTFEYVNQDVFGHYILGEYYSGYSNDILIKEKVNVLLNTNIYNNNTYQKGLEIKFNGICYLNDKQVYSSYKIDDVGRYNVRLIGHNEEYNYTINIVDYYSSSNIDSFDNNSININHSINRVTSDDSLESNNKLKYHSVDINSNDIELKDILWYILIPFITIIVCLYFIISERRKNFE